MLAGSLIDADSGAPRVPRVWRTTHAWDRLRGLLGRPPLGNGEGLLLDPCGSVHTMGMAYAIDVVYLDRAFRITKVVAGLGPWRASMAWRAALTLELAAGSAAALGLVVGRRLRWQAASPA